MLADLGLGLAEALLAVIFVQTVGVAVDAGGFATVLISLVGAAGGIGVQRRLFSRSGSGSSARRIRL